MDVMKHLLNLRLTRVEARLEHGPAVNWMQIQNIMV